MKSEILFVKANCPTMLPKLAAEFTVHNYDAAKDKDALLRAVAPRIRVLVTTAGYGASGKLINSLPNLELIAISGAGVEATDVGAARARNIPVSYTPDTTTDDVSDLVFGLLIGLSRRIVEGDRYIRAGQWLEGGFGYGVQVSGKKLGIIGLGYIGKAIAKRAQGFRLEVSYFGPRRKADQPYRYYDDLVVMAGDVDFLVASCPGGSETRHLVSRAVMAALGPEGILINIARGSVVDESAMIELLQQGKLGGAGLDVYEREPQVAEALKALENVVLVPHIGSSTAETRERMTDLTLANVRAFLAGKPLLTPVS